MNTTTRLSSILWGLSELLLPPCRVREQSFRSYHWDNRYRPELPRCASHKPSRKTISKVPAAYGLDWLLVLLFKESALANTLF